MTDFNFLENDTEKIEFIQSIGTLINNGQIPVELLNENLANCFSISRYLITLYEETTLEYENLKTDFDIWYSEKFCYYRDKLNSDRTKSKFASKEEIQSEVLMNESEYRKWKNDLAVYERRVSFYRRLLDSWKVQSNILVQISQNMRSEMYALSVEKKANEDLTKEQLHRKIKKVKKMEET